MTDADTTQPIHPVAVAAAAESRALWRVVAGAPNESALGFIMSTWSDSYHDGSREVHDLPFRRYRDRMHTRVRRIVARSRAIAAVLPDDETHTLGYLVHEGGTLHYVYVRPARRGYGIARALLAQWLEGYPAVEASHDTKQGAKIIRALSMTYNPLAVEGAE